MLPAVICCPAKSLTPRIFGLESRPLRVEPCPFLWAMTRDPLRLNRRDLDRGQVLAMTVAAHVVLAQAELEDDEAIAAGLLDDLAGDLGARHERLAHRHAAAVTRRHEQDLVEHDRRALVAVEL